jgi:diacylglycerol kinase (ATP)
MKLLFVINKAAGRKINNWESFLSSYFAHSDHEFYSYELDSSYASEKIKQAIVTYKPQRVVAIGGDGTVKLVAECLLYSGIALGIIPAGSANGMAKELQVPESASAALDMVITGVVKKIHVTELNNEYCIHLGDIGLNALMIRVFQKGMQRGKLGYLLAALKVIFRYKRLKVTMQIDDQLINLSAVMIVFANATRYGTGALINPIGKMNDDRFEIIVIKKISYREIYKMMVSHVPFDPLKTTIFQTKTVFIHANRKFHFQVDGEYLGKVSDIRGKLLPGALEVIVPGNKLG